MSDSLFPSPRSPRRRHIGIAMALVAAVATGRAAVSQQTPPVAPPTTATVVKPVGDSSAATDSAATAAQVADSLAGPDSLAPAAPDSMPTAELAAAAAPAETATWPVDPATGQTLINGIPVVGRVFIMQKTDGTVKYPNVADVVAHEALAPLPAVVGTSYTPAPLEWQRRHRGIMVQATLWSMDHKRSATRLRHYPASAPANALGQY